MHTVEGSFSEKFSSKVTAKVEVVAEVEEGSHLFCSEGYRSLNLSELEYKGEDEVTFFKQFKLRCEVSGPNDSVSKNSGPRCKGGSGVVQSSGLGRSRRVALIHI